MAKSATSSLRARWSRSVARSGERGWSSGWAATPTENPPDRVGQLDQVEREGELACAVGGLDGRVSAEGEHVLDAGLAVVDQDLGQLQAAVHDAGEVRHRGEGGGAQHPDHQIVGAPARLAPTAVGDGHERGVERLQVAKGAHERGLLRLVLGWEELEGERAPAGEDVRDARHAEIVPAGCGLTPGVWPRARSCAGARRASWAPRPRRAASSSPPPRPRRRRRRR